MPYDTLMMAAAVQELSRTVVGGRIQKISQPERLELLLAVYSRGEVHRVAISADPARARLHLTKREKPNPAVPPQFCLILRKRVEGARIISVEQAAWDRVATLTLDARDELGAPKTLRLVVEVMGRHSNTVLTDDTGIIVDALKRVGPEENRYRSIWPGVAYVPPPAAGEIDPPAIDHSAMAGLLASAPAGAPVSEVLLKKVRGLGPELAREIAARAGADSRALVGALAEVTTPVLGGSPFDPRAYLDGTGSVVAFSAVPLTASRVGLIVRTFDTPGGLLDFVYGRAEEVARFQRSRENLQRVAENALARVARRAEAQRRELTEASDYERYRRYGDLIKANLHRIPPRSAELEAIDYADEDQPTVIVPLDPTRPPMDVAQRYFRLYSRGKRTVAAAGPRLAATEAEWRYLDAVSSSLTVLDTKGGPSTEDRAALAEIKAELAGAGYLKPDPPAGPRAKKPGKKPAKGRRPSGEGGAEPASTPHRFLTTTGKEILVGRNNRQNDLLTLRLARPDDLWLHVKDIPGSHVILRLAPGEEAKPEEITEAALLAAWF
ncbi:MAG TPA: NFACT RNA binding domain-containing protein, partial [Bacillota bacterium]